MINQTTIEGRITEPAKIKEIDENKKVARLQLINGKNVIEIEAWNDQATIAQNIIIGEEITVHGWLKVDSWQDKKGLLRRKVKVIAKLLKCDHSRKIDNNNEQPKPSPDDIPFY